MDDEKDEFEKMLLDFIEFDRKKADEFKKAGKYSQFDDRNLQVCNSFLEHYLIFRPKRDASIARQARLEGKKEAINFVKQKLLYENGKLASFAQYESEIEKELSSEAGNGGASCVGCGAKLTDKEAKDPCPQCKKLTCGDCWENEKCCKAKKED